MNLTRAQQNLIGTALAEARRQGASPRETKALLEALSVESNFRNLPYGDRDSLGPLQQRPSSGYQHPMDVPLAVRDFLVRARQANTGRGSAGQLAQAVQRSAYPGRYDQAGGVANALLGGSAPRGSGGVSTAYTPGVDRSGDRKALLAQFLLSGGLDNTNALMTLASGLQGAQDTPGTTTRTSYGAASGGAHVTKFDGKPVANWIASELKWARAHGWGGTVTSGYRSRAEQARIYNSGVRPAAKPGTSNHEFTAFPGGAVDVTDPQGLARVLAQNPNAKLKWAGGKDPVHFSVPRNGTY